MAERYQTVFNDMIAALFKDALKMSIKDPGMALFLSRTVRRQNKARKLRQQENDQGIPVPPLLIISVTNRCNLSCVGCYARALRPSPDAEMSPDTLLRIVREADELGISIIMLAGGEPLVRKELLAITRDFPRIIFPVFTNGLLIDDAMLAVFEHHRNLVPIISLEGREEMTDERRGRGIYDYLENIIGKIRSRNIFSGISFTVTNFNFKTLTDETFIKGLIDHGCRIFFFVEYVPVKEGTAEWVLSQAEKRSLLQSLDRLRAHLPGLFVCFPGDEEEFGGCLSSGRGFVHISADGKLEPCPFAPFSDTNLTTLPLREALKSEFLAKIRSHHKELRETTGGCALWAKKEWVASLLQSEED